MAIDASPEVAIRFVGAIEASFEPLRHFPLSGPAREQLGSGLRVTFHSPYAIYYLARPDAVLIVRIVHGARDIAALAERGAFG